MDPVKISLAAIFVSVIIGVFNYVYARNQFQALNYPSLQVTPEVILQHIRGKADPRRYNLQCSITNRHSTVSIEGVVVSFQIADPEKRSRLSRTRWICCAVKEITADIGPSESRKIETAFEPKQIERSRYGIEDFLAERFPSHLKLETSQSQRGENMLVFKVLQKHSYTLKIAVEYSPALHKTKKLTVSQCYKLTPVEEQIEGEPDGLSWWNLVSSE